ncbi:hypothetical protein R5W23_000054 [Gemmata sp. JC673]|uniref:Uncharacterized protein n=1 Tax=Gemmata algarum TaxID=2975278 RepID=A0ABU5ERB9_9BACT|nr:hypothetical protein [Gemmata algarum]MDY3557528.1 hypothetical protein [Gemmata algarum]
MRTPHTRLGVAALAVALFAGAAQTAAAQQPPPPAFYTMPTPQPRLDFPQGPEPQLPRMFYYPYYYFPHSYWPQNSPQWPEPKGHPYVRPPAYQAYPAFKEPGWRYELWTPMKYHRGNHFWLDQF